MTPLKHRDPNPSGLGRAIINRKVKDAQRQQQSGLYAVDVDSANRLKSVTQERDLDEFLNTAQLAGTDFTAERRNVKIIQQSTATSHNPYLPSNAEEEKALQKQQENKKRLRVPRRPSWNKSMTTEELDRLEKTAFLDWRRSIAELQEQENLLLTPFERNLEVWRQLWRVLERSHLVVQIVDARNPLRFRCEDLEDYVQDIEGPQRDAGMQTGKRKNMLLINKADLLTAEQRRRWADYFEEQGIRYAFYSAANAAAIQLARRDAAESKVLASELVGSDRSSSGNEDEDGEASDEDDRYFSAEDSEDNVDPRAKILSVTELEDLLLKMAPDLAAFADSTGAIPSKLVVGLVGYPNVGKSSTINSLLGEKKVSVSSTPGKTKHFQTILLSDSVVLCDCPGLVFPQFATSKAELVCDGVLPIDQMREYTGPITLVVRRIQKKLLEATYGLAIKSRGIEQGGDEEPQAEDFLIAYAIGRGYMRSGQGNPDEARAARYILKDYVNGKLLFCHPPPNTSDSSFNEGTLKNAMARVAGKKLAPVTRVGKDSDTYVTPSNQGLNKGTVASPAFGDKSRLVDRDFFQDSTLSSRPFLKGPKEDGKGFSRPVRYPHQLSTADDGTPLIGHQELFQAAVQNHALGKKHHKKIKKVKQRSGKGYD